MAIMPLPVALRPISSLVQTLPRTKPNTCSRSAFRDEQLGEQRHVGAGEIPHPAFHLAAESIQQPVINDQARRDDEKLAGKARIILPSASAAVLLSNCQISSACITQVLPVPVAIFRQYFG